jgi:hypothetical protein
MTNYTTRRQFLQTAASTGIGLLAAGAIQQSISAAEPDRSVAGAAAKGPLRVHPTNPRYFTDGTKREDGTLRAIYLTRSHTWDNLTDYEPPHEGRPKFDYPAYLDFFRQHHHNFIRLWAAEGLKKEPTLYERTGPGRATDGTPRLNLERLNQAFFDRLRERVAAAGDRGIYVGVMLFRPDAAKQEDWPIHLFNPANNVQALNGDANGDGFGAEAFDLSNERITTFQETYVRKVVDTLNDLDNVLYEIGNEGDASSNKWQHHFIRLIKDYQATKEKQHPVGMTATFDIVSGTWEARHETLFKSPADWISPAGPEDNYHSDPPAADGAKVIIADVDHIWPRGSKTGWIWKCFVRGLHPIHMDSYYGEGPNGISQDEQEAMRRAMGHTLRLAERVDLAAMKPASDLAASGYCLARPGAEYVVYFPDGGESAVDLSAADGELQVEWIEPVSGMITKGPAVQGGGRRTFRAPGDADAVLYLFKK